LNRKRSKSTKGFNPRVTTTTNNRGTAIFGMKRNTMSYNRMNRPETAPSNGVKKTYIQTEKFAREGSCCGQRQFGCAGSGNAEKGCAVIVFQEQGLREIRRNIQFSAENFFRLMNNLRHLIQMRGKCFPHRPFL